MDSESKKGDQGGDGFQSTSATDANGRTHHVVKYGHLLMTPQEKIEAHRAHPDKRLPVFAFETSGHVPPDDLIEYAINHCCAKGKIWAWQQTDGGDYGEEITGVCFYHEDYELHDWKNEVLTKHPEHSMFITHQWL